MPPIAPPKGYIDLAAVYSTAKYSLVSVIGVVVDLQQAKKSTGTDLVMTFKLQDPRLRDDMCSVEGLKVRCFSPDQEGLPPIKAKGDIILLHNIRVSEFLNETLLIALRHNQTKYLVFSGSSVPSPALKLGYVTGNSKLPCQGTHDTKELSIPEQDYIITMKSEMDIPVQPFNSIPAPALTAPSKAAPPGPGKVAAPTGPAPAYSAKFRLVKDIEHKVFSDICVQVVKKFINNRGNCELYVTDYTANNLMFYYAPPEEKPSDLVRDGDRFGYSGPSKQEWPGPYGFLVFKVNLHEPHASVAIRDVAEGDMIALENVKVKTMPDSSRLEGDLWPDQRNKDRVGVRLLRPARKEIIDLCLRKDEYWASRPTKEDKQTAEGEPRLSKKQKKKLRAAKREEEARQSAEKEAAVAEK
jgi:protection-of-telomeres protein 1